MTTVNNELYIDQNINKISPYNHTKQDNSYYNNQINSNIY